MDPIHIHTQLDSTTLHLPQIEPFLGKQVEIIVREESSERAASEADWERFFEVHGTNLIDEHLVEQYRR